MTKYEYNRKERFKSIVAMKAVSWALARNVAVHDKHLYIMVKSFLSYQIWDLVRKLDFLKQLQIQVTAHYREPGDNNHFCDICEEEVHDLIFAKKSDVPSSENSSGSREAQHIIHCGSCAVEYCENLVSDMSDELKL